ncbi:hypothetical protein CCMA1212_008881 [Trichoderma ghanense]|uniref:Uncharacterized protein n=1 Tax=Trichoderma ghanense TaxID=65468 RepID=A0ABY2GUN1_9HYPO
MATNTQTPAVENGIPALQESLKKRCRKALRMRAQKPTWISLSTEKKARFFLDSWDNIPPAHQSQALTGMITDMRNSLSVDGKYAEALARFNTLEVHLFRLKYADYLHLASAPRELQDAARQAAAAPDAVPAMPASRPARDPMPGLHEEPLAFFMTQEWPAILKRLRKEEPVKRRRWLETWEYVADDALYDLCQTLARLNLFSAETLVDTIEEYVKRSSKTPEDSRLAECAAHGTRWQVADLLERDFRKLGSAPQECRAHVPAVREAMGQAVERLLEAFDWDEEFARRLRLLALGDAQW